MKLCAVAFVGGFTVSFHPSVGDGARPVGWYFTQNSGSARGWYSKTATTHGVTTQTTTAAAIQTSMSARRKGKSKQTKQEFNDLSYHQFSVHFYSSENIWKVKKSVMSVCKEVQKDCQMHFMAVKKFSGCFSFVIHANSWLLITQALLNSNRSRFPLYFLHTLTF